MCMKHRPPATQIVTEKAASGDRRGCWYKSILSAREPIVVITATGLMLILKSKEISKQGDAIRLVHIHSLGIGSAHILESQILESQNPPPSRRA